MDKALVKLRALNYNVYDEGDNRFFVEKPNEIRLYKEGERVGASLTDIICPFEFPFYIGRDKFGKYHYYNNDYMELTIEDELVDTIAVLNAHVKDALHNCCIKKRTRLYTETRNGGKSKILVYNPNKEEFIAVEPRGEITLGYGYGITYNTEAEEMQVFGIERDYKYKIPVLLRGEINNLLKFIKQYRCPYIYYGVRVGDKAYVFNILNGNLIDTPFNISEETLLNISYQMFKKHTVAEFESIYKGRVYSGLRILGAECSGDTNLVKFQKLDEKSLLPEEMTFLCKDNTLLTEYEYWHGVNNKLEG